MARALHGIPHIVLTKSRMCLYEIERPFVSNLLHPIIEKQTTYCFFVVFLCFGKGTRLDLIVTMSVVHTAWDNKQTKLLKHYFIRCHSFIIVVEHDDDY